MDMVNVAICPKCRTGIISEEIVNHSCTPSYKIEGNILWIRSRLGVWNKHTIPSSVLRNAKAQIVNHSEHPEKPPRFRTEPLSGSENHYMVVNTGIDQDLYITSEYH